MNKWKVSKNNHKNPSETEGEIIEIMWFQQHRKKINRLKKVNKASWAHRRITEDLIPIHLSFSGRGGKRRRNYKVL